MIVLVERAAAEGRLGLLDGEDHHLKVRRARDGELVELRDGGGLVGRGRLVRAGGEWQVEVLDVESRPVPPALCLAVGAGDRDRLGWVVEKAVELGVTTVVPLETDRTAGVATRLRGGQVARLRRQALEAVKQSGNPWACTVEEPTPLRAFLAAPPAGERWLADAAGSPPPATLGEGACTIVIGPEGGLTHGERDAVEASGYRAVRLGPHILRFETAAVAAAAAVQSARLRGHDG
ncbi:MAG TPA: RsmE family RNA methyltransferase [Gemmatimonadales bacterium]